MISHHTPDAKDDIDAILARLYHPTLPTVDLGLDRVLQLLAALGNPQEKLPPVIHVAGTNGKGSTIAYLRAMYEAAGLRVHVYTSPHLVRFHERIVLAGSEISDVQLLPYLQRIEEASAAHPVTFFEATTAAAFLAFSEHAADILLLETGLGGRLDATNVVTQPICTIITPIADDHREFLGDTLAKIAGEKAGIMKPGVPCISAPQEAEALDVLRVFAERLQSPLIAAQEDWHFSRKENQLRVVFENHKLHLPLPNLTGAHQLINAAVAVAAALQCSSFVPISEAAIAKGLQTAHWPARLQKLAQGPLAEKWPEDVYLDGGHNAHAAQALAVWAAGQSHKPAMICAMLKRKSAEDFFRALAPQLSALVCIPLPSPEDGYSAQELAAMARAAGVEQVMQAESALAALEILQPCSPAPLLIGGSLYLAGEILKNHG